MVKRKHSGDHEVSPHALKSLYADDPTRRQHKRLFRSKHIKQRLWGPEKERDMTQLLEFILQHEEAFQNKYRITSLYADIRQQYEINPEGYYANVAVWTKALVDASRAGVIPTQGATHDLLSVRASDELARALQHPTYGKPTCLPAVFHEAIQKKEMVSRKDFMTAKESIYKTSWVPSPWQVLQWGLRQVGVLGQSSVPAKMAVQDFVILKNVEVAADEILKKMKDHISAADRVMSKADFLQRFSKILNPAAPLTTNDLDVLLIYMARDKQVISYNGQTIKFKLELDPSPEPITQEDEAVVNLRDTLANIIAQLGPIYEKIVEADATAREAVALKHMGRAKAALRHKKLAENALAHRSDIALQLESVYNKLQEAHDQVGIVEAMRAGADALKTLNEKAGGAEGVQGIVDAVNEQMATTEEITNIINETDCPLDEAEIDDDLEALEKAEKEKQEAAEAAKTAARLARLTELENRRKAKEDAEKCMYGDQQAEANIDKASEGLSRMSFRQEDPEDAELEERVLLPG